MKNAFTNAIYNGDTLTENGALSNSTTGSFLVDQFGKSGSHRGRSFDEVATDMSKIWEDNPLFSTRFTFYLRMITRKVKGIEADKVQMGQGNRDEAFKRFLWIHNRAPQVFYENLWLMPVLGSWKDMWTIMLLADELSIKIDRTKFFELMAAGIRDDNQKALIQKFLPQIKSTAKCKTDRAKKLNLLAKQFCTFIGWDAKTYRKFKASGEAHVFQKNICLGLFDKLDWNRIPGRALSTLASGKFLAKHGLEASYLKWIESQPTAKFTGYPYELLLKVNGKPNKVTEVTANKQFEGLIELAKKNGTGLDGNVWCAIDTSGSMESQVGDTGVRAIDICMGLGIYFASLNQGAFHNHVVMFDSVSRVKKLTGTFIDKVKQINAGPVAWGSTNFQSVIDEIVRVRKANPNIPVEDYPQTLLVVSDMQFNPSGYGRASDGAVKTNYQEMMAKLAAVGLPSMRVIWWDCTGRCKDFPSTMDDLGTYMVSGFDGAIVTMLCNVEKKVDEKTGEVRELNMEEKVINALSQDALQLVKA
jgi:hypothetical protein